MYFDFFCSNHNYFWQAFIFLQVQCNYSDYFVCQSPLLSTVQGTNLTINGEKVPYLQASFIRQWLTQGSTFTNSLSIQISFPHMVTIRYFYTAWTITSIKYSNNMTNGGNSTAQALQIQTSLDGLPTNVQADHTIIANVIWLNLTKTEIQKSPYLELRGCDLEGFYIFF